MEPDRELSQAPAIGVGPQALQGIRPRGPGLVQPVPRRRPGKPQHVYLGLEEVFETRNGGTTWHAIGPYWNFTLPCSDNGLDSCPKTTHPDQHVVAFGGGKVWVGNDGGVYSRSLGQSPSSPAGWNNLNETLRTLQYYGAGAGTAAAGNNHGAGTMAWGGMRATASRCSRPASRDGEPVRWRRGAQLVEPTDGDKTIAEYVGLDMWRTTNGGYAPANTPSGLSSVNAWTEMTPACGAFTYTPNPCDPLPRFIAPFAWDDAHRDHWVAGGQFVWDNGGKGWDTSCSSSGVRLEAGPRHRGRSQASTALSVSGSTIYAGWCAPGSGCNPATSSTSGAGFSSGMARTPGEPGTRSPACSRTATSARSRSIPPSRPGCTSTPPWADSHGGGSTTPAWATCSSPRTVARRGPTSAVTCRTRRHEILILTSSGNLVVATDVGVFTADTTNHTAWSQLGGSLPNAVVDDLCLYPGGVSILAATHGRGLWRITTPA